MDAKPANKRIFQLSRTNVTRIFIHSLLGAVFFIAGFNFSNTVFFNEHPLFEIPFLAEILISFAFAAFGFHTVPILYERLKERIENILQTTVSKIVWDFWEQQSRRMQTSHRARQREKKRETDAKLKQTYDGSIFLDTSVLIDGRVVDIAKTGFLGSSLTLPQVVLNELHLISDSEDDLKRQRGRRGLDIIEDLKKIVKVSIYPHSKGKNTIVDKELIQLTKKHKASLMTVDFNLNKVAKIEGIKVLNINDLVNALKPAVLPGEKLKIKIVQKGKEKTQGVGYLEDGTMVVVEEAKNLIGKTVDTVVSRLIQTPAGKMIFTMLTSRADKSGSADTPTEKEE